jgi:uncharacterized protein YqeY
LHPAARFFMLRRMVTDELKKRVSEAVKSGDTVARDVLRLALGELQTAEARKNTPLSDDEAGAVVRKLVKSNEETLGLTTDQERRTALQREIEVLTSVLPASLTPDQIAELLASQSDAIRAAKNDGQATGVAMKHLKTAGANASGADVTAAVKKIRGS